MNSLGGRPPKWETPEQLSDLINKYFDETEQDEYTVTGLCLYLDTNKQTLLNYQAKEEYSHIIDMAKMKVEHAYELSLRKNGRSGDIFALKNFGWTDKQEIEHTGESVGTSINIIGIEPKKYIEEDEQS